MSYSESVLTEDYLNKFNALNNPGIKSEIDQDSEYTGDIHKFNSFNPAISYEPAVSMPFDDKDALNIERKFQEILKKRKARGNYGGNTYPATIPHQPDSFRAADEQSTVIDDYSNEIHHKKTTILKDIEMERRDNNRLRSMSPGLRNGWKLNDGNMSPRESLEHKINELDQLSSSVKRATSEHQQLCTDLEEMRGQLRRQQADIRLSERLAHDKEARVDYVQRELRDAERRRDQIQRQVDLANEELELKKAKLRNLDTQMMRGMADIRKMDRLGIDRDEIETILAERDELYQIVKKQEHIQNEKYELAKQMDMMRVDFESEYEKAQHQIQYLEDEVEASMRKIKQLQCDNDTLKSELTQTKETLSEAENEVCKSSREVAELRGDYQTKIRKKLDEYEMDKEKVEKELKKLEQEKSLDQANLKSHIEQIRLELRNTEQERQSLQEMVTDLEEHLKQSHEQNNLLLREYEEKLKQAEFRKNADIDDLKRQLSKEHQLASDEQKIRFGEEKNRIQKQCDEEMDHLLRNIELKDQEICALQHHLKAAESDHSTKLTEERSRFETMLKQEKNSQERSITKRFEDEIMKIKDESDREVKRKRDDLNDTKSKLLVKENEIAELKRKLHDLTQDNKRIETDGIIKIRKMKEEIVNSLKSRYEKKMDDELVKVKAEFEKRQSEKTARHQQEIMTMEDHDKHTRFLLNKVVKTVVHEINQECKKMAVLLNVKPRKVPHTKFGDNLTRSDNIITQSIANLEACGSETRTLVCELESEVRKISERNQENTEKFEREIEEVRRCLDVEKQKDVAIIRERLMKEHLQEISKLAKSPDHGLKQLVKDKDREITRLLGERETWKERAAEKIADKFDKINHKKMTQLRSQLLQKDRELRQARSMKLRGNARQRSLSPTLTNRSLSRTTQRKSSQNSSRLQRNSSPGSRRLDENPARIIGGLQESLEELRRENTELRQRMTTSNNGRGSRQKESVDEWCYFNPYISRQDGLRLRLSRSCSRSRE